MWNNEDDEGDDVDIFDEVGEYDDDEDYEDYEDYDTDDPFFDFSEGEVEELEVAVAEGVIELSDGCVVELGGECEHGIKSPLLENNLI